MAFAAATFVICIAATLGTYWLLVLKPEESNTRAVTSRLRSLDPTRASATTGVTSAEQRISNVPTLERLLHRHQGFTNSLQRLLVEADVKLTAGVFLALSLALAAVGWTVGLWVVRLFVAAIALALLAGALPLFYVRRKRSTRLNTFEEQFPEAVDLIARSLRAGHAFTTGLGIAAEELPPPVGAEFKKVYDQQNFGMSLPDALRTMAARVPVLDARFFVTAVLTQRESGGNLAEVLNNLSSVMRERFKVRRQIRVISAHGRLSGWILSLVPPGLAAILFTLQPSFMSILIEDPIGIQLVAAAVALQLLGSYIISRLVKIEY